MAKATLTVATEFGKTVTRQTARTYTHVVVVAHERSEKLEAIRQARLASAQQRFADYSDPTNPDFVRRTIRRNDPVAQAWDEKCHAESIADGSYAKWAQDKAAEIEKLEAQGTISEDSDVVFALGWCGRLDLAQKLAETRQVELYRHVHVYEVATGRRVQ